MPWIWSISCGHFGQLGAPSPRLVAVVRGEAGAVAVGVGAVDVAVVKRGAGEASHLDQRMRGVTPLVRMRIPLGVGGQLSVVVVWW